MWRTINEKWPFGLSVLSGICGIASLALDRPYLTLALIAAATVCLLIWHIRRTPNLVTAPPLEAATNADVATDIAEVSAKKWIDHAYCDSSGSITAYFDGFTRQAETCALCQGLGQIFTDLWNQPRCRRCQGSGKLTDEEYVPSLRQVGHLVVQHHQHNKLTKPCDVCNGTGRRPRHPEETT